MLLSFRIKMTISERWAFCVILCHIVGVALPADTSYYKPGMNVKWGAVDDTINRGKEFFFDIALTTFQAESRDGWVEVPLPSCTYYSDKLSMRCPANDFSFCAFYDEYNDFAGLQVSMPVNVITNPVPVDQKAVGAILWSAPALEGGVAQDYWSFQLYIVDDASLEKTKEERDLLRAAKNTLLYNNALWISDTEFYSNSNLRKVVDTETGLEEEEYFRQRCYLGMGRHYLYDIYDRRRCVDYDPWFPLASSGSNLLHGIGIILQAIIPDPAEDSTLRTWFEHQVPSGVNYSTPDSPQCQQDLAGLDNYRTIHMTFIYEPWNIKCTDESDFKPLGLDS